MTRAQRGLVRARDFLARAPLRGKRALRRNVARARRLRRRRQRHAPRSRMHLRCKSFATAGKAAQALPGCRCVGIRTQHGHAQDACEIEGRVASTEQQYAKEWAEVDAAAAGRAQWRGAPRSGLRRGCAQPRCARRAAACCSSGAYSASRKAGRAPMTTRSAACSSAAGAPAMRRSPPPRLNTGEGGGPASSRPAKPAGSNASESGASSDSMLRLNAPRAPAPPRGRSCAACSSPR
jgi:hypothetical protein